MKKIIIYALIVMMFGGVISIAIQAITHNTDNTPIISETCELIGPGMLFADDSIDAGGVPKIPPFD